jgi:Holliday junction resolvasome RuvABC endonuclease subunit
MESQPATSLEGLRIIGMDPAAFRNCGWAVVEFKDGKPTLLEKFTQKITREENDIGRLQDVYDALERLIAQWGALILCLERSTGGGLIFVRSNLNESVGVAKLCCHRHGIKTVEISPAHLKKVIAGDGRAKKKHIIANMAAIFGLKKPGPEHECDAAALCLGYLIDQGWTGYQIAVPFSEADRAAAMSKRKKPRKAAIPPPPPSSEVPCQAGDPSW